MSLVAAAAADSMTPGGGIGMEDRVKFSMLNLFGREVQVTKTNGCRIDGVFCTSDSPSPSSTFSLRYCRHVAGVKPDLEFAYRDRIRINWEDVETVVAVKAGGRAGHEFDPAATAIAPASAKKKSVVTTDSSISAQKHGPSSSQQQMPRGELKPVHQDWLPASTSLQAAPTQDNNRAWDQFETNRAKFGVKSTFKPDMYTTELKRETFTKEQFERAGELERGIEIKASSGGNSSNAHMREERGQETAGDEEARFGAVQQHQQQAQEGEGKSSWASMVKGAEQPVVSVTKTAVATAVATTTADKPVTSNKKREEEIRGFKEFSQTYQSPSAGPSKARKGTPPPSMDLAAPAAPAAPAIPAPAAKKKLNPKAKDYTPAMALPVQSQPVAMYPPPARINMSHPRHYQQQQQPMPPMGGYYGGPPPPYYAPPQYYPPPPRAVMGGYYPGQYMYPHMIPIPPPHPDHFAQAPQPQQPE
ncbi:hypothetical protein BASA81_006337 [Batrachochytrium salamandrivorans]|nr:hypothetical protein BASA81_006337 [Batrachochytrium salamandrivorans]